MKITANTITTEAYDVIKTRKERESVKKTLIAFLNEKIEVMKTDEIAEINFDKDVHYYSVLNALRVFNAKIEYKLNSLKSRVFSIAIKKL
jgi:hypothetical protein